MSDSEMDDLFNEFFSERRDIPPPTPEEIRLEAMTITELHLNAFYLSEEAGKDAWYEMLPEWLSEFKHYLPILEDFEEYEQCAKVFKAMKEIREADANYRLNKELDELEVRTVHEAQPDNDEPDF